MWTVRAVRIDDLPQLEALVRGATRGLTSLQLNHEQILDRIEQSVFAFSRTGQSPKDEPFVLVLVDGASGELAGTSTIYAKTGGFEPFYSYRLVTRDHHSPLLGVSHRRTLLELNRIHDGPSEIGSLFLRGAQRGQGRGRWLSLARFTLIASRRPRFANRVIAEMRGKADADGSVPFWDAVTGRFIPVDFAVADTMSTVSKAFIQDLMPEHPIYLDLLPDRVRTHIGHVHDETRPAVELLTAEGFQRTDEVDIFDAGPVLSCATEEIRAIKRSRDAVVSEVIKTRPPSDARPNVIVASGAGGFTSLVTHQADDRVVMTADEADALGVEPGSPCWVTPLYDRHDR